MVWKGRKLLTRSIKYSFFNLKIFIKCLLCVRYCSKGLGSISEQNKNLCPLGAYMTDVCVSYAFCGMYLWVFFQHAFMVCNTSGASTHLERFSSSHPPKLARSDDEKSQFLAQEKTKLRIYFQMRHCVYGGYLRSDTLCVQKAWSGSMWCLTFFVWNCFCRKSVLHLSQLT